MILTPDGIENVALGARARKIEMALKVWYDIYKPKSTSFQTTMKNYCVIVRPSCLYAAQTPVRIEDPLVEKIKYIRKILGPQ